MGSARLNGEMDPQGRMPSGGVVEQADIGENHRRCAEVGGGVDRPLP